MKAPHHSDHLPATTGNERLIRFLNATPEQAEQIDAILENRPKAAPQSSGPLLMGMTEAARMLGVSRVTLWRMIKIGKLRRIEVLPGSFRVRRADIEALGGP